MCIRDSPALGLPDPPAARRGRAAGGSGRPSAGRITALHGGRTAHGAGAPNVSRCARRPYEGHGERRAHEN
eukprot:11648202-Alexandrium_andersonii.AAC.1